MHKNSILAPSFMNLTHGFLSFTRGLMIVCLALQLGCAAEHESFVQDAQGADSGGSTEAPPVAFEDLLPALISVDSGPKCAKCHNETANRDAFTAGIARYADAIFSNRMPLGGPPVPDEVKALLQQWIDGGLQ